MSEPINNMDEVASKLEEIRLATLPVSELLEAGRADIIIANGTVQAAKDHIISIKDHHRRQSLIAKNLAIFEL